jgi:hypothetical protein
MSSSPLARGRDRAVEALPRGDLPLARREAAVVGGANLHRIPAHRHARGQLRPFVIGPQALTGVEQAIVEMAPRVQPAERGFGEVYRHAAPPRRHAATPAGAFGGEFALGEVLLHGNLLQSGSLTLDKPGSCRKVEITLSVIRSEE